MAPGEIACVCGIHVTAAEGARVVRALGRVYGRCHCQGKPRMRAQVGRSAILLGGRALSFDEPTFPHVEHALVVLAVESLRQVALHAAAFVLDRRLFVAVGRHGAGKTTLARAAARAGAEVLADDIVLVDAHGRVSGLPRAQLIKGAAGTRYQPPSTGRTRASLAGTLVFLARGRDKVAENVGLGGLATAQRLLEQAFTTRAPHARVVATLGALARRCPGQLLRYREADDAIAFLRDTPAADDLRRARRQIASTRRGGESGGGRVAAPT